MVQTAMAINASWDVSAEQYVEMYRYGLLIKNWNRQRQQLIDNFIDTLGPKAALFDRFFIPGEKEYGDKFNWDLKQTLEGK